MMLCYSKTRKIKYFLDGYIVWGRIHNFTHELKTANKTDRYFIHFRCWILYMKFSVIQ